MDTTFTRGRIFLRAFAAAATLLVLAVSPMAIGRAAELGAPARSHAPPARILGATDPAAVGSTPGGLGLDVAAAFDRVEPGDRFTYTLRYSNTAAVPIPDAVLTAALSSGQVFADEWLATPELPDGSYSHALGSPVHLWQLGALAPGQSGRIDMVVHVGEQHPDVDLPILGVGCSARLSSTAGEFGAKEGLAQAMVLGPILQLVKKGPKDVYPGRPMAYELSLKAYGPRAGRPDAIAATAVQITETIPAGTSFLSASSGGASFMNGARVRWTLPAPLQPDADVVVTMALRADPSAAAGTRYTNPVHRYRAYATQLGATGLFGDASVSTTVLDPLEVSVDTGRLVGGRHEVYPGEVVTYTILAHNPEPSSLVGTTVVFTLPENGAAAPATDSPYFAFGAPVGDTPAPTVEGRRLTWAAVGLPPWGERELTFTAQVDRHAYTLDRPGGVQYPIGGLEVTHPSAVFPTYLDRSTAAVVPALALNKSVRPLTTLIRRPVTYTLSIENRSPYPVAGLTVSDTVRGAQPTAPMSFTYGSALGTSPEPLAMGAPPWVWTDLAVGAGQTLAISYTALADGLPGTQYVSDLDAFTPDTSTPGARNKAVLLIDSPLDARAVVSPTDTYLDQPVHYGLEMENVDAKAYHLNDVQVELPSGVKLTDGGSLFDAPQAPAMELAPGATWSAGFDAVAGDGITCRSLPTSRSIAASKLRAYVDELPSGFYTNRVPRAALRILPNVSTALTATRETAFPGDVVTYTLRFDNASPVDAVGMAVTLRLPKGFEYIDMVQGGDPTLGGDIAGLGQELTWAPLDVAVGARAWIEVHARVSSKPGTYAALVTEAGLGRTCLEGRNGGRVEVLKPGETYLEIHKTVARQVLPPGSLVSYGVEFNNRDRDPVVLDVVTDTMPVGFRFHAMNPGVGVPGDPEVHGQSLLWRDVAVNGKTSRKWGYTLQSPALFGGAYENLLQAHSTQLPITRTVSVTVSLVPQVLLSKIAGARDVQVGQTLPYTITVANNAEEKFVGVRITDTLPAGVTYVKTLSGAQSPVAVGPGNSQPAWQVDLDRHERQLIVFQVRVGSGAANGVLYNRLDGYSPRVTIASVDRAAPITVTGSVATPTRAPSQTPGLPSPTPAPGSPTAGPGSPTAPSPSATPLDRRPTIWLPRVLQR